MIYFSNSVNCNLEYWYCTFFFGSNLLPMQVLKHFIAGSPSGNNLTPGGPCRYDSSLGNMIIPVLFCYHYFISFIQG